MKLDPLLNRRVIFKLHGMDPLDSTILKQDATGYWIRGGSLAPILDQSNCSQHNDVRFLEFTRIEWLRAPRERIKY
ncbi:MAG: hypothetical protein WBQ85_13825 [Candidatus Sulfotelmatobacter sp.]